MNDTGVVVYRLSFVCLPLIRHMGGYVCMYVCAGVYMYDCELNMYTYLPNPSAQAGYDTRSIFKRCLTGLNSEFSFS